MSWFCGKGPRQGYDLDVIFFDNLILHFIMLCDAWIVKEDRNEQKSRVVHIS